MYKKINWLRAGILSCDKLLTVSPNYATEISANPQGGAELDHVIRCVPSSPITPCRAGSQNSLSGDFVPGLPPVRPGICWLPSFENDACCKKDGADLLVLTRAVFCTPAVRPLPD